MFDWDDLKVFLAVARLESLSAAGKLLKRDPATVGRRIARLEADLGQPLFSKSPTGYVMTQAAVRLLQHAEQAERVITSGAEEFAGETGQLSGQVRIGATDGCASYVLPQVCAAIQRAHPHLELQIVALSRVVNLSKREADMAITVSVPQAGRITAQKITDYKLHLAASRDYLASAPKLTCLADLKDHPIVGYIQDMIFYPELDFLTRLGVEKLALASNLVSVQLGMLREGGGIGVCHDFALPFAPNLVPVLCEELSITRSLYLVRHEGDARVERFARVAEALTCGIRDEVARLESANAI